MADIIREQVVRDDESTPRKNAPSSVAWLALLIASLALILAFVAYNRSGENLGAQVQQETNQAAEELDQNTQGTQRGLQQDLIN